MFLDYVPGDFVINPKNRSWGIGQIQSVINKKVTALLYANLAEAYMWINDFDSADNYLQKAKIGGISKYKTFAKRLQDVLNRLKARYEVNN